MRYGCRPRNATSCCVGVASVASGDRRVEAAGSPRISSADDLPRGCERRLRHAGGQRLGLPRRRARSHACVDVSSRLTITAKRVGTMRPAAEVERRVEVGGLPGRERGGRRPPGTGRPDRHRARPSFTSSSRSSPRAVRPMLSTTPIVWVASARTSHSGARCLVVPLIGGHAVEHDRRCGRSDAARAVDELHDGAPSGCLRSGRSM